MAADTGETVPISARIPVALNRRVDKAASGPLAPSKTQMIVEGLTLVLQKLEAEKR